MKNGDSKGVKLNYFTTTKFLLQFITDFKIEYSLFYVGWLFHTIVLVITPIIFGIMVNQIVYYQNLNLFITLGMVFLFVTVFGVILYFLIYEMYAYLWNAVNRQLRLKLFRSLMRLSMTEYNKLKHGETVNMIEFWSIEGVNFLIRNVVHFLNNLVLLIVSIGIIFFINWRFALITIILVPISVTISLHIGKKVRSNSDKNKDMYASYFSWLFELVHAFTEIRFLGAEKKVCTQFEQKQTAINENNTKIAFDNLIAKESLVNIKNIILLAQYVLLAYLAIKNDMTIGTITALLTFFNIVSNTLTEVVERCIDAQKRISKIQQIKDFLDQGNYCDHVQDQVPLQDKVECIEFQNCCFSYGEEAILNDISFTVRKGQKIAVVGNSGSGKSTLLSLLLNFYEPTSGKVLVNGKNMNEINIESFYRHVSVVFQNVLLLKGNIKNNILMGKIDSEEKMIDSCKAAAIYDEISLMEQGFESYVEGAGSNLSGGQRQRIGIARAYVRDADVVVLDEATSALDAENESKIVNEWKRILVNKIGVIVSHRLHVVMNCDYVIMLNSGRICAKGTPLQMMENQEFRDLFGIT